MRYEGYRREASLRVNRQSGHYLAVGYGIQRRRPLEKSMELINVTPTSIRTAARMTTTITAFS